MHPTSVLSTLALAVPLAFAAPFPSARIPLLGYSSPEPFLGLEAAELAKPIGTVAFIPRFHPCGTLLVLSVDDLSFDDLALLPHSASNASLWALYDSAPTNLLQDDAVEGTALAWMRGWRSTCGKGEHNREVRVASLTVDGADRSDKAAWARSLGASCSPSPLCVRVSRLIRLERTQTSTPSRTSRRSLPRLTTPSCSSRPCRPRPSAPPLISRPLLPGVAHPHPPAAAPRGRTSPRAAAARTASSSAPWATWSTSRSRARSSSR